jgi:hypothetical protein
MQGRNSQLQHPKLHIPTNCHWWEQNKRGAEHGLEKGQLSLLGTKKRRAWVGERPTVTARSKEAESMGWGEGQLSLLGAEQTSAQIGVGRKQYLVGKREAVVRGDRDGQHVLVPVDDGVGDGGQGGVVGSQ